MKKILILLASVGCILVMYFGQIAYMRGFNENTFNMVVDNIKDNKYVKLKNVSFQKGFFTSDASFDLEIMALPDESDALANLPVHIRIANNFFASSNFEGSVKNNLEQLKTLIKSDVLLNFKTSISLSKKAKTIFTVPNLDIDTVLKYKDVSFEIETDLSGKFYSYVGKIKESAFSHGRDNIKFINVFFNENIPGGLAIDEAIKGILREGTSSISIDKIELNGGSVIDKLVASQNVKSNGDETSNIDAKFTISKFSLPDLLQPETFDNFVLDVKLLDLSDAVYYEIVDCISPICSDNTLFDSLAKQPLTIDIKEFSLSKNGKKVISNANIVFAGKKQHSAKIKIVSDARIGEIFPILSFFGDFEQYFVQKDGKYVTEIEYFVETESDTVSSSMKINGTPLPDVNF